MDVETEAETTRQQFRRLNVPFDATMLDGLMDQAGLDVLVVTSKHNVQYLLGGYRYFFFDRVDAIGQSRYLPILVYPRGAPEKAAYFGNGMEVYEQELTPLWLPEVHTRFWGTLDAMAAATAYLRSIGRASANIGIEQAFMPVDAYLAMRNVLPDSRIADALVPLEKLRAVKTPTELDSLRLASTGVVDAILAVFASHGPGTTKRELVSALRLEQQARDLTFEFCLPTVGTSHNRAPSTNETWEIGQPLCLDSGGNVRGYIGDVCRMAVMGEPDAELEDLFAEILAIQDVSIREIKAGALGGAAYTAGMDLLRRSKNREHTHFVVHGLGLVSHEIPHLVDTGPVPYAAGDAGRPLQAGMVLSVETTMLHPRRGYVKLEDTIAVLSDGFEFFGEAGRCLSRGRL